MRGIFTMTKAGARTFLLSCFAAAALLPCAAAGARAETPDQLYENAKREGALVFYSGGPAAPHENRAKEFMQKYPGITVSVTGGFSNVLNEQIEKQIADRKLQVDMAFFQTVQDFVSWKKQGKLLAFKPDGFDQILPNFRDEDGSYMALSANALTYAYNTSRVRPEDAPASAPDFLKPMFAGKVITCYPADDDATLYLFHLIVQKYGWAWMDKYMATKPNFVQGHLPVARSVASGENIASFDASSSVWPFRREGKLEVVWSPVDETPVFTLTGGIFRDAPHPNAAKLYLTWFLAKEQQSRIGSFSSRVDVPPPEGMQPLASYKIANSYREFMTDERLIADLRKRFEAYTGPPINKGGVR
jgi:ABC-type Fe3+ transport system substrate-binding protein